MNNRNLLITALVILLLIPLTCKSENLFYYAGKEKYSLFLYLLKERLSPLRL